ncbi:uncharacterized protein LOC125543628 [Triticum urartu]|uniref:uncharacterized protein LOC125543628 n=1 Tax=Triticum urartu TaxID=4572 RepID=UPI0020434357|nr:uncharacterized protein LOC125543628 [Triticum urartu]
MHALLWTTTSSSPSAHPVLLEPARIFATTDRGRSWYQHMFLLQPVKPKLEPVELFATTGGTLSWDQQVFLLHRLGSFYGRDAPTPVLQPSSVEASSWRAATSCRNPQMFPHGEKLQPAMASCDLAHSAIVGGAGGGGLESCAGGRRRQAASGRLRGACKQGRKELHRGKKLYMRARQRLNRIVKHTRIVWVHDDRPKFEPARRLLALA